MCKFFYNNFISFAIILFVIFHYGNAEAAALEDEDEGCEKLLQEFTTICFRAPPKTAIVETRAFCQAFRDGCKKSLLIVEPPKPQDPEKYCAHHRERFRYVCPDPTRLGKYSEVAIEFCPRYQNFCPDEPLPTKPEPFKEKLSKHIYIREHQFFCDLHDEWAKVYCFNPTILKVPIYRWRCGEYKIHCIDPQTESFYGFRWPNLLLIFARSVKNLRKKANASVTITSSMKAAASRWRERTNA